MKPEKLFFPLMVFAAVITVYLLFRKSPATSQTQPSTSASGVPNYATESPTSYNVQTPQVQASPLVYLADPASNDPGNAAGGSSWNVFRPATQNVGSDSGGAPSYLTFNFGPSHDLNKVPLRDLNQYQKAAMGKGRAPNEPASASGGCGGCSGKGSGDCNSCDQNQNAFSDGPGRTLMASTLARNVDNAPKSFLEIAQANLDAQPGEIFAESPTVPVSRMVSAQFVGARSERTPTIPQLPDIELAHVGLGMQFVA